MIKESSKDRELLLGLSKKELTIIIIGSFLSAACCITYTDTGPSLASLIFSSIFVVFAFCLPIEQQLMMVALAIPNTKALGFYGVSASICVCAVAVMKHFLKEKKKPRVPILAFFFVVYSLQYFFRFSDPVVGIVMPIKTLFNIVFFTYLTSRIEIAQDSYAYGFKASMALFLGILSAFWTSGASVEGTDRAAVEGNDPNMLAIEVAFVFSYLCVYYYTGNKISQTSFIVSTVVLGIISVYCGSRMGFILFGLIIFLSVALNIKSISKSTVLIAIISISLFFFLTSEVGQNLIEVLMIRMINMENNDDMSNGRLVLWNLYTTILNSNPLLWLFGMGKYTEYGIEMQAHNAIIESVAGYGIIGTFVLYLIYIRIYVKQYKICKKHNKISKGFFLKVPFIVPLVGGITLHSYDTIMNTTMLYIGVLCMTKPRKQKSEPSETCTESMIIEKEI